MRAASGARARHFNRRCARPSARRNDFALHDLAERLDVLAKRVLFDRAVRRAAEDVRVRGERGVISALAKEGDARALRVRVAPCAEAERVGRQPRRARVRRARRTVSGSQQRTPSAEVKKRVEPRRVFVPHTPMMSCVCPCITCSSAPVSTCHSLPKPSQLP